MTREEAINQLQHILNWTEHHDEKEIDAYDEEAIEYAIKALEQEPKTGHWIDTGSGQECSECGEIQYGYDNFRCFCANCGAKMVEPQESEEKK